MPAAGQHKMEPRARLKCHQASLLSGCDVAIEGTSSVARRSAIPLFLTMRRVSQTSMQRPAERAQDEVAPDLVPARRAGARTCGRSAGRGRSRK